MKALPTLTAALAISLLGQATLAADDPMTISVKRLTLASAQQVAQGAIEACRDKGIQIGVTVVDRDGVIQAQLRDTIAAPITVPISYKKAYTAANFNAATSALESRADTGVGRQPFLIMSAGGLTIEAGGTLLGAVGVSGAPSGETDEACARAGIAAIQDDLELSL
ncbi:GlcG/HbpS family heme-binding protein [Rhabdochromatium marinum]|uniref:GlcG/HbpS family heme-binding protein n=1 Tax=Rhabdochromatium marinum TaxID=48729 RepID=UPI001F5BC157|nr:heme-binding protein [Rhabdochromatium marinum]MBK1648787.1 adenosylcobalamin biosynthesis, GlcG-related protein [Rhabdochromatium marinum]